MMFGILRDRRLSSLLGRSAGGDRRGRLACAPVVLALEGRQLLATLMVSNTDATGRGSLARAIETANGDNKANTIKFEAKVFDTPKTIQLDGRQLALTNTHGMQRIIGPAGMVTISGQNKSRVFRIGSRVRADLSNLKITNGNAHGDGNGEAGGGVLNVGRTTTLTNCIITGNKSHSIGGGLANDSGISEKSRNLTLIGCTISDNSSSSGGAGVASFAPNSTLTLTACTLSGNTAGEGGGGVETEGKVFLTNCTISGNTGSYGGVTVLSSNGEGEMTLTACTISRNIAKSSGGGIYVRSPSSVTLLDTIVAGNTVGDTNGSPSDISGTVDASSSDFNLIGTGGSGGIVSGAAGNIVLTTLTKLGLAPLGNNGGPTQTMALQKGSEAIGAGTQEFYAGTNIPLTTDERGSPLSNPVDIGAYQGTL